MDDMQNIPINEKIRWRREELVLSDTEVAHVSRLTIHSYGDIESDAEEIRNITPLYNVKKICEVLKLPLLDLFDIPCAFCSEGMSHHDDYWLDRSTLVQKRRRALGMSTDDLGDRVGFEAREIENIETYTAHLESWVMDNILELSAILRIPSQVLLDVRCSRCGM